MTRTMIRAVAVAAALGLTAVGMTACSGTGGGGGGAKGTIGISMPTKDNERWIREANNMTKVFEKAGYDTDIQFANNDTATQVNQVENMITKGEKALVISSVDGSAMSSVADDAGDAGIPVFAYTRLIEKSKSVDYYTTFDYYDYGYQSALSIARGLGLLDAKNQPTGKKGPFNVEAFAGSPTDNVARYQYDAFLKVFKPFIADGSVVVRSGQTTFDQVATLNWDGQNAQSRMEDIIAKSYSNGQKVDAVFVPYDGMTRGVISALEDAGYEPGSSDWPYLPGGDAEVDSVKAILAGEQYSTVFTDTRTLSTETAQMVIRVVEGKKPTQKLDTKTYDNGAKVVPSLLVPVQNVTKDDVQKVLVDTGYYTAADLGLN